ncbi:MAG: TonB-dependent receptor [Bacteroidia bacterium]|nr:TonB-dependent receptor [Bacteroidia bacterium]
MSRAFFLVLFFLPLFSFSQQFIIKGTVKDGADDTRLVGVKVVIDTTGGTMTDGEGNYSLKVKPGKHHLDFFLTNYQNEAREIKIEANGEEEITLDVTMTEEGHNLNAVVISASQYEKNLAEETVSIDIIDKSLFKNNNATNLGEAVNKSVGVQVQDEQITIRGGSGYAYGVGSRTAVLVDNMSFASADLGEAQLKQAPLENTEQVEVVKGAASVIYGSSALNGVVNMITAWPTKPIATEISMFSGIYGNPPRPELNWWDSLGWRNFSGMSFSHQRKMENFDLILGGNLNLVNSYLEKADEGRVRFSFKTRYRHPTIKGMSFGMNGAVMRENSGRFFLPVDVDSNAYKFGDGSTDRYLRTNLDPHFVWLTDGGTKHRVLIRYLNVFRFGNGGDVSASSNAFNFDYQYQKRWAEKYVLTAGLPFGFGVSRSNLFPGTRYTVNGAVYVQAEAKFGRFNVTGGVRYEGNAVLQPNLPDSLNTDSIQTAQATIPVFRSGINYRFGKATFFRASLGQAYRLPSVGERFITASSGVLNVIPNPGLLPEKGWSFEFGIKQGLKISKWMGFLDFAAFWNEYDNFVEYRFGNYVPNPIPPGSNPFDFIGLKPFNLPKSRVAGFEGSIYGKGYLGPIEVRTLMGYTYTYPGDLQRDSAQQDPGIFLKNMFTSLFQRQQEILDLSDPLNPKVTQSSGILNYRTRHLVKGDIEFFWKRYSFGYTVFYGSYPERIDPEFFLAVKGLAAYSAAHVKGDWVHGIRFGYNVSGKCKVGFIVKNLFNRFYSVRPGKAEAPLNYTLQLNFNL